MDILKICVIFLMTSITMKTHAFLSMKTHRRHHSSSKHVQHHNRRLSNSYVWTHDLGDIKVHETATVNQTTQTVVMASSDRSLLQLHIRPSVTFHDFKTGLIAIKIRNKFKGHHKGFGGNHARRAQSTCYIIPVRTSFIETMREILSRNGKTVNFPVTTRHFVTSPSTMADFERSAFSHKSHFLSRACRTSAIINSQTMPTGFNADIKRRVKVMSVWGSIVIRQTFENHHARIYKEFTNRIARLPHAWRFTKYHG